MIQGFEEETKPLNDFELKTIVPIIVGKLSNNKGKKLQVTNNRISECMKQKGYDLSGEKIRSILHYIRVNDLIPCLVATTKGYYVATSKDELIDYEKSLMGRINSITEVFNSIQRQRVQVFGV